MSSATEGSGSTFSRHQPFNSQVLLHGGRRNKAIAVWERLVGSPDVGAGIAGGMDVGFGDSEGRGDACKEIDSKSIGGKGKGCNLEKKRPKYWTPQPSFLVEPSAINLLRIVK